MNTNSSSARKRTHLKPDQVNILQESFNGNALPDSTVRTKLARDLGVTERTIQIWFQNRRAKARKTETYQQTVGDISSNSKSGWIEPNTRHPTPPRYQATFRTMMTPERFEELKHQDGQQIRKRPRSSSKPERKSLDLINSMQHRAMSEGTSHVVFPTAIEGTPIQMIHFPVHVLRIGSWTRFAHASPNTNQKDWDLVCYGSPLDHEFIWKVQAEGHHFRIQVKFDSISQIRLRQHVQLETGDIVGQLEIELNLPVAFSMWRFGEDNQWIRCGDFTEDKQATVDSVHMLQGNHESFKQSLLDLISLAPELASKISVMPLIQPQPPALDICRDFTISPSATPEPSSLFAAAASQQMMYPPYIPYGAIHPQHFSKTNMSHLMLQAPFFYPPTASSSSNNNSQELYQMIQQQQQLQQQQQQMMYAPPVLM